MDAKEREGVVRTVRDLFRLAGRVRLDVGDSGRLLPVLAPADLWRSFPTLLRNAVSLAEMIGETRVEGIDVRFMGDLAETIERGHKAGKEGAT